MMAAATIATVVGMDRARISRALEGRARYRYVRPRVLAQAQGWKIVSPNCSRNIDPQGGDIDIALLLPDPDGGWLVHARDHAAGCWLLKGGHPTLAQALAQVCTDPDREFWP